jgi:hypothetical protein
MAMGALILFCAASYAQSIRMTIRSGNWSNKNTWDCNCVPAPTDHAIVVSGHVVTFVSSNTIRHLTIEAGGTLTDNGLVNTITGNLLVNGTYSGSGIINLTGNSATLDGTGIISNLSDIYVSGHKTIPSTASLTINSSTIHIDGAFTITNHGTMTVGGNISGTTEGSTWINETNSVLNVGGSSGVPLLATGTLQASAPGNTVNYYATYAHTLKLPVMSGGYHTYHHLKISGSNTKTLPNGDVAVNGDLTINSTFSGSGSSKKLYLRGNWINNGNFTEGAGQGTITFDGSGDQFVYRAATENMNVVVVNKPSGNLILRTSLVAERGLTLMGGDIDTGDYKITLGLSASVPGVLSWTTGKVIGRLERWIATAGVPVLFPIGTPAHYRPASVLFTTLTPGTLEAEFLTTSPGNNGLPLTEDGVTLHNTFRDGYWSLTAANSLDTLNASVHLTGNDFTGFAIHDNTRLLKRSSSIQPWSLSGMHLGRIDNTISRANLTELTGHYCFGDDTNCLAPVTAAVTGLTEVCKQSGGLVYSVTDNPPNTYSWKVSGGTIISGQGTNSITVDWGAAGKEGSVSVVEKNACTEGPEISLPVIIHALPPVAITGKVNVPENDAMAETYSVPVIPNYTYTWSVTGGTIASGQGTAAISVNWGNPGTGTICVIANHAPALPPASCGQSVSYCASITIYRVINSIKSGNWQTKGNWDCGCVPAAADNVTIRSTHSISLSGGGQTVNHVNINAGGAINTNSNTLTIQGDVALNGVLSGAGNVVLNGANTYLSGVGVITNSGTLNITSNKEILSNTSLTKTTGAITLGAGVVVVNHGIITTGGSITGGDVNSQWINSDQSYLNIGGDLLTTGKLYASAAGNTVRYFGSAAQLMKTPEALQYANVMLSGSGAKTAPAIIQVSGNFINDGNFLSNNGTVRFNGNSLVTGSSLTTFHHVSLQSGSTLTFPSGSINILGNIDFEAGSNFDPSNGTVILNGVTTQYVDVHGVGLSTLQIDKASGTVEVNSLLPILRLLDFKSSTLLNTHDQLVIKSRGITTDLDGSIGALPSAGLISGKVIVERHIDPIGRTFRYVASPVAGAFAPSVPGSSLFEQVFTAGVGNWQLRSSLIPLERSKGYAFLLPGVATHITWTVSGPIQQGTFTWNFPEEGWHLLGNPFPSSIRWRNDPSAWQLTNIATTIAVTDNSLAGGYPNYFRYWSYDAVDNPDDWGAGELQNGVVAMGQAFWVYVGEGGGSLTIDEPAKENNLPGEFYRSSGTIDHHLLKLILHDGKTADVAYLRLHPKAKEGYDFNYDVVKLRNHEMDLYWREPTGKELIINTLHEIEGGMSLPIGMDVQTPGDYTLNFENAENFLHGNQLFLVDAFTGKAVPITGGTYAFHADESSLSLRDRFYLSMDVQPERLLTTVDIYPNPVKDKLTILIPQEETAMVTLIDTKGRILWERELTGEDEIDMSSYPGGVYLLRIRMRTGKVVLRRVVR